MTGKEGADGMDERIEKGWGGLVGRDSTPNGGIIAYLVIDINKSVQHIRKHFDNHVTGIGLHDCTTIDQNRGVKL